MVFKRRRQVRAGPFDGVTNGSAVLLRVAPMVGPASETESDALPLAELRCENVPAAASIEIELNGAPVPVTGMFAAMQLRLVLQCLMPA
jgi:hypothetical protein